MKTENKEVLLKVEHLEQWFKFGRRYLKAVDDVNFNKTSLNIIIKSL